MVVDLKQIPEKSIRDDHNPQPVEIALYGRGEIFKNRHRKICIGAANLTLKREKIYVIKISTTKY